MTMQVDEAMVLAREGKIVRSNRFDYRIRAGVLERLNGWWQPIVWPLDEDELRFEGWTEVRG